MRFVLCVAVALLASSIAATATVTDKQRERLNEATTVLQDIRSARDKGLPAELWDEARCVAVVPAVVKAAFIVGGEFGKGVMSCRHGSDWSAPAFMLIGKGSVGFQIGGESVNLVLLFMNERGVNRLLDNKTTLEAEASAAAGPVGRDARALTDAQLRAEILSYSRTQGLFAGVNVTGGVLKADNDENAGIYGPNATMRDILMDPKVQPPAESAPFLNTLNKTMPPSGKTR
jgi:SH3 domain-containing YSC84-like protein 1